MVSVRVLDASKSVLDIGVGNEGLNLAGQFPDSAGPRIDAAGMELTARLQIPAPGFRDQATYLFGLIDDLLVVR